MNNFLRVNIGLLKEYSKTKEEREVLNKVLKLIEIYEEEIK